MLPADRELLALTALGAFVLGFAIGGAIRRLWLRLVLVVLLLAALLGVLVTTQLWRVLVEGREL